MNPRNNVPYHFPYDQALSVTAKDARTVVARLRAPSAPFVAGFFRCGAQGAILPKHLLGGKPDLNQDPFNSKPVGSGPYLVQRYDPNSVIEMVPNPYWYGGKPGLQRITYRIVPNENTLLVSLRTHELDFYLGCARAAAPRAARAAGRRGRTRRRRRSSRCSCSTRAMRRSPTCASAARPRRPSTSRRSRAKSTSTSTCPTGATCSRARGRTRRSPIRRRTIRPRRARCSTKPAGNPVRDGVRVKDGKRLEVEISTVAGVIPRQNAEVFMQQQLKASRLRSARAQRAREHGVRAVRRGRAVRDGQVRPRDLRLDAEPRSRRHPDGRPGVDPAARRKLLRARRRAARPAASAGARDVRPPAAQEALRAGRAPPRRGAAVPHDRVARERRTPGTTTCTASSRRKP